MLEPYVRAGVARVWTVTDHSHDAEHGQFGHRDECTQQNVMNATWIAMIDADEFLFPTVGYNVTRHLLTQCNPDLSFLMVRWHMYGSNGVARRPDGSLVTDLYRMHSRVDSKVSALSRGRRRKCGGGAACGAPYPFCLLFPT